MTFFHPKYAPSQAHDAPHARTDAQARATVDADGQPARARRAAAGAQNWAWSSVQGNYDWMDQHVTSFTLD
jgi:hypothetical protein